MSAVTPSFTNASYQGKPAPGFAAANKQAAFGNNLTDSISFSPPSNAGAAILGSVGGFTTLGLSVLGGAGRTKVAAAAAGAISAAVGGLLYNLAKPTAEQKQEDRNTYAEETARLNYIA
jgi:hypothetical protein